MTDIDGFLFVARIGDKDDFFVHFADGFHVFARIVQLVQEVADTVQTCTFFVVGADDDPRRVAGVGVEEHGVFGFGVVVPTVERLDVHRGEFPVFQRVVAAGDEAAQLFFAGYGEPEFEEVDAAGDELSLIHI